MVVGSKNEFIIPKTLLEFSSVDVLRSLFGMVSQSQIITDRIDCVISKNVKKN